MTLATVSETTRHGRMRLSRYGRLSFGVDALLMGASFAICAALFTQGGLECLAGALAGAAIGARKTAQGDRVRAAFAGGFAGLFAGALFAGFFHGAVSTLAATL